MDYPFDTVGLGSEQIDSYYETYQALKARFNIDFTGHIDFHLEDFEVFRQYFNISMRDSFVIKKAIDDCYLLFVDAHIRKPGYKGSGIIDTYHHQTWALAYLKKDFGRVLIRPETLTDKIIELIHPVELDFDEDKAFSDTFYVLVNDHQKAVTAIDRNFRNAVMDIRHDNLIIEIVNHTLLIGNPYAITPQKAVHLAEFVVRICSSC